MCFDLSNTTFYNPHLNASVFEFERWKSGSVELVFCSSLFKRYIHSRSSVLIFQDYIPNFCLECKLCKSFFTLSVA